MILGELIGIAKKVLDKVLPDKLSEAEKAKIQTDTAMAMQEAIMEDKALFQKFVIDYEGAAKDMPKSIQVLRGSVRPILTYLLILSTLYIVWQGAEIPAKLHQLDLLAAGFWFGERAVANVIKARNGHGQ